MSSRSRLLLLSGPGGCGTSEVAAAAVGSLAEEGLRALLVDAGDPADGAAQQSVADSLGRVLVDLGSDPVVAEAWGSLPGLAEVSALQRAAAGLSDPAFDVVVVDCGPLAAAARLVALPDVLLRLLDAALTPATAMWRDAEVPTVFEVLSRSRSDVLRLAAMLTHPDTSLRVVTTPERADAVPAFVADAAILGLRVDGVIVTRVARRKDPGPLAARHESVLADLERSVAPVTVWRAGRRLRAAPRGLSVAAALPAAPVISADLDVRATDDGFQARVRLPESTGEVRIGRRGDDLVVTTDRVVRWVPLPGMLARCRVDVVRRDEAGLLLDLSPDPDLWPRAAS